MRGYVTHYDYRYSYTVESKSYRVVVVKRIPTILRSIIFHEQTYRDTRHTALTTVNCPSKTLTVPLRVYYFRANKTNLFFFYISSYY